MWSEDVTARLWDISTDYDFPPEHLQTCRYPSANLYARELSREKAAD